MRQVFIYPGEDGYWVSECPSLPGCISQGKTRQEAIQNIKDAIEVYVAVLEEDGLPIPEEKCEALFARSHAPRSDFFFFRPAVRGGCIPTEPMGTSNTG